MPVHVPVPVPVPDLFASCCLGQLARTTAEGEHARTEIGEIEKPGTGTGTFAGDSTHRVRWLERALQ